MAASIIFFNDTATTEIYTRSLHDALPIFRRGGRPRRPRRPRVGRCAVHGLRRLAAQPRLEMAPQARKSRRRSEEHTSELQSRQYLVCRLLLEKKNIT